MKTKKKFRFLTIFLTLIFICGMLSGCNKKSYTDTVYPLSRNGINIHFDCMVLDNAKIKDNILLVHGLTYSSHEFDVDYEDYSLVKFLCNNGYCVWRLDVSGYGQSDIVEDGFTVNSEYASQDIALAIEEIIKITGAKDIDLLGWSWGTVTSSLAEKKESEYIDKFILYAPILSGLGYKEVTGDYHENTWEDAASDFQSDDKITDKAVMDLYCSNCEKYDKEKSPNGGRVDLFVDKSVILINLEEITSPTLVICGDKDPYLNYSLVNDSVIDSLPGGSKYVCIQGSSHALMLEKPYHNEFQNEILDFLTK